jgi:hypothetical protein
VPKHRAQRQPEVSDRGVRFRHAMTGVTAALRGNRRGGTRAGEGEDVHQFAERPGMRRPLPRGWLSGALVNPWFAAGTGLVIAAGLALYAPHKVVAFLPNETNPALCASHSCNSGGNASGSLATSRPGMPIKPGGHANSRALDSGATAVARNRISVHLAVTRQHEGKFIALVTLRSRHKLASWRLAVSLPNAQIEMVLGAKWQANGQHGGTATPLVSDGGGKGGAQGDWRDLPSVGHWHESRNGRVAQFWIIGTGSAAGHIGCVLDGHSCHVQLRRARH